MLMRYMFSYYNIKKNFAYAKISILYYVFIADSSYVLNVFIVSFYSYYPKIYKSFEDLEENSEDKLKDKIKIKFLIKPKMI